MQVSSLGLLKCMLLGSMSMLAVTPAMAEGESCQPITPSGPITVTSSGQVIENLDITAVNGQPAILVNGFSDVVIRNVRIHHKKAHGIRLTHANRTKIENVSISYEDYPAAGPNPGEFNNIDAQNSNDIRITRAKLEHGSSGIYMNHAPGAQLSWIEGYDFRGPFPRGQLVQFNNSNNGSLTDFSVVNDRTKAWTEDNVNVHTSSNITIKRGLVDGNNSNSGVGVIADAGAHFVLVEDVDALHQGGGCFSANQSEGTEVATDITFNRTRCRDNSIESWQNRGRPGSNGLAWCAQPDTKRVSLLDSIHYNLAVPYNITWNWTTFVVADYREENFTPRRPLGLTFCWDQGGTGPIPQPPVVVPPVIVPPAPTPPVVTPPVVTPPVVTPPAPTPPVVTPPEPTPPAPTPPVVTPPAPTPPVVTPPPAIDMPVLTVPAGSAIMHLSDLNETYSYSIVGHFEKNRSIGETGRNDGNPIRLLGTEFLKGLGEHSDSDIRYDLKGKCSTFSAVVGIDDEVGQNGSARFRVFGDNQELYHSDVLKGGKGTATAIVDIRGFRELKLVVDKVEDWNYDHADWADAKIVCSSAQEVITPGYFLSDLKPTLALNGWGPLEMDQSNGHGNANDGRRLRIGEATFNKGLGTHADSEIHYKLGGVCKRFTAQVGIDEEVGSYGKARFRVLADGTELYVGGTAVGGQPAQPVSVDVSGRQELVLMVDSLDGGNSDHADWAEAKLDCDQAPPTADEPIAPTPTAPAPQGDRTVYLSDLKEANSSNGWGPFEKDRSNGETGAHDGRSLTLKGITYKKGLGVHADSTIEYSGLPANCTKFNAVVGLDDETNRQGKVQFRVIGNDKVLYNSPEISGIMDNRKVEVDVTGINNLRLIVDALGDGSHDHADWADASLTCKN